MGPMSPELISKQHIHLFLFIYFVPNAMIQAVFFSLLFMRILYAIRLTDVVIFLFAFLKQASIFFGKHFHSRVILIEIKVKFAPQSLCQVTNTS